jgi:hypothetical protein
VVDIRAHCLVGLLGDDDGDRAVRLDLADVGHQLGMQGREILRRGRLARNITPANARRWGGPGSRHRPEVCVERFAGDVGAQAVQNWLRKAHCRSGLRIRMRRLAVAAQPVHQRPLRQDRQRRLQIRRNPAVRCLLTTRSPPAVALALLPPRRHAQLDVETCHVAKGGSTCGRRDQVAQFAQRSTPSPSPFRLDGYRRSVATIANCGWAGVLPPGDEVRSVLRGISHAESAYQ